MKTNFKMNKSFGLLAIIFALPMLMLYQNCSKVGVSDIPDGVGVSNTGTPGSGCAVGDPTCNNAPPPTTNNPPPDTCTTFVTKATNVKVFFLVDISGSNQSGQSGIAATDPASSGACSSATVTDIMASPNCKKWRLGVLDKFLGVGGETGGYLGSAGFSFQIGVFQGTKASALIVDSAKKTMFSSDKPTVEMAVQNFLRKQDNDNTPYQAVLNMAASAIQQDLGGAKLDPATTSKYVVVMLTDGMPTDDNFSTGNPATNIANLKSAVAQLANVAPGYITFNTVLYYPASGADKNAQDYLQAMADAGHGAFLNSQSSVIPFPIDNKITVPTGSTNCPDGTPM